MNKTARFWNRIAERYAKQPVADEATYQEKLQITREYFRPDMEVFEFGCGTGSTALAHAPFVRWIRATDVSEKMIAIARGKAEAAGVDNVTFTVAAIDEYPVTDQGVDAVMGHSILHLLDKREEVIARVCRMLRPGGIFITSTVCISDMAWYYRLFGMVLPIGSALGFLPPVKIFSEEKLVENLTAAGFAIDHQWRPGRNKAVFIVARKPE